MVAEIDQLQYDIVHGKYNRRSKSPFKISNISSHVADETPHEGIRVFEERRAMDETRSSGFNQSSLGDSYVVDGNRFLNNNKKNLNSCNFMGLASYHQYTPRSHY